MELIISKLNYTSLINNKKKDYFYLFINKEQAKQTNICYLFIFFEERNRRSKYLFYFLYQYKFFFSNLNLLFPNGKIVNNTSLGGCRR